MVNTLSWPTGGEGNKSQYLISKSETNPNAQNTRSKTAEQKISQLSRVSSVWLFEFCFCLGFSAENFGFISSEFIW